MELKDFTEQEQKQIEKGLSTAEISDKEAAKKLLALVPQEWIKRIPFFVRGHATTKTVERVASNILNFMQRLSAKGTFLKKREKSSVKSCQASLKKK